jgi:hypothetical protein
MQTPIRSIALMRAETSQVVALLVQSIKVAVFFLTMGIPSAMHDGISFRTAGFFTVMHAIERPHSNPRRNRES